MSFKLLNTYIIYRSIILSAIFIIIYLFCYSLFNKDKIASPLEYDLERDGFYVIKNLLSSDDIEQIKVNVEKDDYKTTKEYIISHPNLNNMINGTGYVFQDYVWIIKRSSVHTCHRDNNGDFFNKGQKYPSYTMLIFIEDMDKCLGVIPTSHLESNRNKFNINITDQVKNIPCNKGDAILFNANLIHVGALNSTKDDNLRIQMKISHKDDIQVLSYYENYNKVLDEKNNLSYTIRNMQKNISCLFPGISDFTQGENINSARGTDNGAKIGVSQKIFSYLFYGNSNFYDLPNAF